MRTIDRALPQTQCTKCGYPRCHDYARAISRGEADINRCPPGGEETIALLAHITGRAAHALDPACGEHETRQRALIDEAVCIGCTKCIQVCPVDAIVGSAKLMHTVLAQECTGCTLCLPPCPVDCIELVADVARTPGDPWPEYNQGDIARSRRRTIARRRRLTRICRERAERASLRRRAVGDNGSKPGSQQIRDEIRAAVARARARRGEKR